MTYTEIEVFLSIVTIGLFTYLARLLFLLYSPKFLSNQRIKSALDGIPAAMLVALVIPTTLFNNGKVDLLRSEVFAIIFSVPIVYRFRYSGLGLISAVTLLILLTTVFG